MFAHIRITRYAILCLMLPACIMAAASSSGQQAPQINTLADLQAYVEQIAEIANSAEFMQESAQARARIQEQMATGISHAASALRTALSANQPQAVVAEIHRDIAQAIAPAIDLFAHNTIALGIIAYLVRPDAQLYAQLTASTQAHAVAPTSLSGRLVRSEPSGVGGSASSSSSSSLSGRSPLRAETGSSSSSSSARAKREREEEAHAEFEQAKVQRTAHESLPERIIPTLQEMAIKQIIKVDIPAATRTESLRKRLAHLLPPAQIDAIAAQIEKNLIKEHVDLKTLSIADIQAIVQTLHLPIYISKLVINELATLIAKEHFFALPIQQRNNTLTIVQELLPAEFRPYFKGVSIQDLLDHNIRLRAINLNNMHINDLTGLDQFDAREQILLLSDNHITTLPAHIFNHFTQLQDLYLEFNNLEMLPTGIFNHLIHLQQLHLNNNALTALPAEIFNNLALLQLLYLQDNKLVTLPTDIFNGTKLEYLNLSNNKLTTLPDTIFNTLTDMQTLILSHNQLETLSANLFSHLTNLIQLQLDNNALTTLPAGIFNNLTSLQWLYLQNNRLTTLPVGIFNHLTNLEAIDLSGNNFSQEEQNRITAELRAIDPDMLIKW